MSKRIRTSGRSIPLILFGHARLVPQESLLLKSIMTYFGMVLFNMTLIMLQDKRKGKPSFPFRLIQLINLTMTLEKTLSMTMMRMIPPHTQYSNLLSTLLDLNKLLRFLSLTNFLREQGSLSLTTTRSSIPGHALMVPSLNLNLLWRNPFQSPSKPIFMRMIILLKIHLKKILLKQWYMSV